MPTRLHSQTVCSKPFVGFYLPVKMLIAALHSLVDSATIFYCTKLKDSTKGNFSFRTIQMFYFVLVISFESKLWRNSLAHLLTVRGNSLKLEWNSINLIFVRKRSRPVKISNNECTYFSCSSPAIFWFHRRCIEYAKILKLKEEISSFSIPVAILAQFTLSLLSQSRIQWLGKETSDSHTFLYNNVRPAGPRIPQPGPF